MSAPMMQLHWTQRVALVRHSLHCASRSGDFGFFKALQVAGMMNGTNHFATLNAMLGDEADVVLAGLDNLNSALAFVYQDAFQNVYDSLKHSTRDDDRQADKSKLYADINSQKNKADMALDTLSSSATALIHQQPVNVQDEAANVYITGMTLAADCVEVVIKQLDSIEQKIDDSARLEESLDNVKASVLAATAGLKGIFYMLNHCDSEQNTPSRNLSVSSANNMFRRISNAFVTTPSSRSSSVVSLGALRTSFAPATSPVYRNPAHIRSAASLGCPTSMSNNVATQNHNFDAHSFDFHQCHRLATIPPTPAQEEKDPFDMTDIAVDPILANGHCRVSTAVM